MEAEKILKAALDEQLTREIARIPSEEEIGRNHIFEDSFLTYMKQLITREQRKNCKKRWFNSSSFVRMAASLVCLVGIGTLLFAAFPSMFAGNSNKKDFIMSTEEAPMDAEYEMGAESNDNQASGAVTEENGNFATDDGKSSSLQEDMAEEFFTFKSQSFDGEYHVRTEIRNTTDQEITYTPVYGWSYTLDGETTGVTTDMDLEGARELLKPGETIAETYNLKTYGITKGGGVLELTREINKQEVVLTIEVEEMETGK